ncbi:outer membrane beta-barrel protein [Segetibacter aerophilus]|uniref:Outer membrane protein beta-barrel domain-containing protein n=1 Tax=Segetibacter aerophilus TaxID=670293 RepID=A0A512BE47_9BACT|nr:outer membrane beta-barrel protein [Segetibacter aerophilus]GEO10238.1 hypothetical protein SAE01_27340 [Segetibacter aerophilus]
MDENLHNIDHLFRKAIAGHEEEPSTNVWENIDKNLDKKNVVSISKKYRKLKWAAAALLIFSAGLAMYTVQTRLRNKELAKTISRKKMAERNGGNNKAFPKTGISDAKPLEKEVIEEPVPTTRIDSAHTTVDSNETVAKAGKQTATEKVGLPGAEQKVEDGNSTQTVKLSGKRVKTARKTEEALVVYKGSKERNAVSTMNSKAANFSAADNSKGTQNAGASTLKPVGDLATATERPKDLQIQSPDPLLENILKSASENNKIPTAEPLVLAKNSKVKGDHRFTFSITPYYSADFVNTRIDNGQRWFREDDRNEIKNKEEISKTSSIGVLVDYNLDSRWSLQSGISFSTMTTNIQPKTIFARPDPRGNINYRFNCSSGYSFVTLRRGNAPASGDSVIALSSTNTLNYVSVPLAVKYVFSKGKLSLSPGLGVAANFLTKGKIETEIAGSAGNEKASIDHIEGLNNSYFSGLVSLGVDYSLNKTLALSFTPTSRIALSAINKDAPVKTYLSSFGLVGGLRINF